MKRQKSTQYKGYRTAGIRLQEAPAADVPTGSSVADPRQLLACHAFDKAHLVMLAEQKLIPRRDAALMLAKLREIERDDPARVLAEAGGGIHAGEQLLIRTLSEEVGGRIHLGRSSGDLDRVAAKIRQREGLLACLSAVLAFRGALMEAAKKHARTVMPGYTHGQQAQPLTLGFVFLHWEAALARDFTRLLSAYRNVNLSPAGAGALAGSDFALDRHRVADLLGFGEPYENTLDAVHTADDQLEAFSAAAILHGNLGRFACDLIFLAGSELALVDLPDRFCSVSSVLPQKKNPVALEHIRGAAAETLGSLVTAFGAEAGATGLAVFPRHHYAGPALDKALTLLSRDLGWLAAIVAGLQAEEKKMEALAASLWATAADLASALVRERDLPWRTAHQIVAILVRICSERGIGPAAVTGRHLDAAAREYRGEPLGLTTAFVREALSPRASVERRTLYGGPAAQESLRRIAALRRRLGKDRACLADLQKTLASAAARLEEAIDAILARHAGDAR